MGLHTSPDADSPRPWAPTMCLILAGAGVVVVLAGAIWKWRAASAPEKFWTQEQAVEYAAAHDAYHASLHDHEGAGHAHEGESAGALPEARERLARIDADLQRAQYARDRVGPLLMQIGVAVAIAFGVGYLISQRESD